MRFLLVVFKKKTDLDVDFIDLDVQIVDVTES